LADDSSDQNGQANASNKLYGGISKFSVLNEDVQSNIGIKCTTNGDGFRVTAVEPGSEAYKKGVQVGDLVLNAQVDKNDIGLGLEAQENHSDRVSAYVHGSKKRGAAGTDVSPASRKECR
jgi:predicted metalloprotease with PDZ domain